MHICLVSLYYNASLARCSPQQYLAQIAMERPLAQALAALDHQVDVVLLFPQRAQVSQGNVHYHFLPAGSHSRQAARVIGALTGREWTRALAALPAIRHLRQLQPDVVHFHGLILTFNLFCLWLYLGRRAPPLVGQYHGGFPAQNPLIRRLQAFNLHRLSRALFTTRAHAQPFLSAGLLQQSQVVELMEVSTTFQMRSRKSARAETGMAGRPVFLWAGRLHPVKDPLTALRGFAHIQAAWPQAHLYLYYLTGELMPELQAFLAQQPHLVPHVHFRGRVAHERMEAVFNSADFLLQASDREYSGFAVVEAMACGTIPVVTDIPAFRALTSAGRYGILFPRGDSGALARQVLAIDLASIPARAVATRRHFEREFSFATMARRLVAVYREVQREQREVA